MSPRVTYWTGTWDPTKEAISKEVSVLRSGDRALSPVVSFSPGQRTQWRRRERVLMLSGNAWLTLRAVAAVVEPRGDITHIFGGQFSWHLFRALGRRPIVLTAVAAHAGRTELPWRNVVRVAVEIDAGVDEWLDLGVARDRIVLIRPGVDLEWYRTAPPPSSSRFTLLLASTPSDPAEIEARGIGLLVELARRRPECDILVPWRQWGDVAAAKRALEALLPPANFLVHHEPIDDMRAYYARSHATVFGFAPGAGKACPNFVIEGFASGRPCLTISSSGIAPQVRASGAGVVVERDAPSLAAGVDRLRTEWAGYAAQARALAEREFSLRRFLSQYERVYADVFVEEREAVGRYDAKREERQRH